MIAPLIRRPFRGAFKPGCSPTSNFCRKFALSFRSLWLRRSATAPAVRRSTTHFSAASDSPTPVGGSVANAEMIGKNPAEKIAENQFTEEHLVAMAGGF